MIWLIRGFNIYQYRSYGLVWLQYLLLIPFQTQIMIQPKFSLLPMMTTLLERIWTGINNPTMLSISFHNYETLEMSYSSTSCAHLITNIFLAKIKFLWVVMNNTKLRKSSSLCTCFFHIQKHDIFCFVYTIDLNTSFLVTKNHEKQPT